MSRLMHRWFLWFVLLMLTLSAVPLAAQTPGPDVAQWRQGAPSVRETFRSDTGAWTVDTGRNPARFIADGTLVIQVADPDQLLWVPHNQTFADFYLEVDTAHVEGPLDNLIGIVFRLQDNQNFYLFAISSDGMFSAGKYVGDKWQSLVEWQPADAIETGEGSENRIGLLAVGDQIVFLINNEELARVQDRTFTKGKIGLLAGSNVEGGVVVAFDNVWLWSAAATRATIGRKPPTPTAAPTPTKATPRGDATVKSAKVNVRGGPSTSYPVVATLQQGDVVRIIGRTADSQWVKIELAGQSQAWVAASLLDIAIDLAKVAVAAAPSPPPTPRPAANVAYLVIENHIGRFITVQVNDQNFRVEGKVGDQPGRYRFTLPGVGRYRIAAQLPGGGSHNWDLYVEPTPDKCVGRQGCIALGQTFTQVYY